MVAEISGKKMGSVENMIAITRCSRIEGKVGEKLSYVGFGSCTAANLAFGGPSSCVYACVGMGECAESCPFDAITMDHSFPIVNAVLCVGCGSCVRACPKNIMELIPSKARTWVPCNTKDSAKEVKKVCEAGCISCKMCVKSCPAKAVEIEEGIVIIDHDSCVQYGAECGEICIEKCPRNIFRNFHTDEELVREASSETAA